MEPIEHRMPKEQTEPRMKVSKAIAIVATVAATGFPPAPARAASTTFTPVADAYVNSRHPNAHYGGAKSLKIRRGPLLRSYLRFDVTLPTGATVTAARLAVNARSSSGSGFAVDAVNDNRWGERSLTYANAPAPGRVLGRARRWTKVGYTSVSLTPQAISRGLNSLVMTAPTAAAKSFASRETATKPRLVVTYSVPAPAVVSAPAHLSVTAATQTSVSVSWSPPVAGGVAGYDVYVNDARVAATSQTSWSVGGLTCGTRYTLAVSAYDVLGNRSSAVGVDAATADCPDTTAPTAPTVAAGATTGTSISLSWSGSSDNVAVVGYELYRDGALAASTAQTSYTFSGLSCGTSHTFAVAAFDAAGNRSPQSSLTAATSGCPPPASPVPVPATGVYLGAWVKEQSTIPWNEPGVTDLETLIGRKLAIDHHYFDFSDNFPYAPETWDLQNGRIPMFSWDPKGVTLDAINAGNYDQYIHDRAVALKNLGEPVFLRPMSEMNGDWSDWDGYHNKTPGTTDGPSKFVQAWRRMHDIFSSVGATNVAWVWSPNASDVPSESWNDFRNYYPGDAYVDWVGMDVYNWGSTQTWSTWRSFAAISAAVYGAYAGAKPIMIAETGSAEEGGSKAQWIADAAAVMKSSMPAVHALVWFDAQGKCDWRVDSSQTALEAFIALAVDPYFNP